MIIDQKPEAITNEHRFTSEKEFQKEFSFKLIERLIKMIFVQHKGAIETKNVSVHWKNNEIFWHCAKLVRSRKEEKISRNRVAYMHISWKVSRAT